MKKLLSVLITISFFSIGYSQVKTGTTTQVKPKVVTTTQTQSKVAVEAGKAELTFETEVHDFGKIEKGVIAKYKFKFTNTGTAPLWLTDVHPGCGCTTPTWNKDTIPPGGVGYIEAAYNSNAGHGTFSKAISVTSNAQVDPPKVLIIKGEVMVQDENSISPVRLEGNN